MQPFAGSLEGSLAKHILNIAFCLFKGEAGPGNASVCILGGNWPIMAFDESDFVQRRSLYKGRSDLMFPWVTSRRPWGRQCR